MTTPSIPQLLAQLNLMHGQIETQARMIAALTEANEALTAENRALRKAVKQRERRRPPRGRTKGCRDRARQVWEAVSQHPTATVDELAEMCDLPPGTVQGLLAGLKQLDYIDWQPRTTRAREVDVFFASIPTDAVHPPTPSFNLIASIVRAYEAGGLTASEAADLHRRYASGGSTELPECRHGVRCAVLLHGAPVCVLCLVESRTAAQIHHTTIDSQQSSPDATRKLPV